MALQRRRTTSVDVSVDVIKQFSHFYQIPIIDLINSFNNCI